MDSLMVKLPYHEHPVTPVKIESERCAMCEMLFFGITDGYKCELCNLKFHLNCVEPKTIIHPSHSLHPLKLFKGYPPAYTDGECRLCGFSLCDFYHCSTCNFSLHWDCLYKPPPQHLEDQNIHDHQLTLFPKLISFTCTICGLNGDRSPYVCLPCDFIIHNGCARKTFYHSDCIGYPWVININRHDHRVSRTFLIGVVDSVCGICRKKMDWSCGGYSCQKCPNQTFHTECATREDVWDGKEMKDEPEEDEDVQPFKVIDENTIQHVSHPDEGHNLRLDKSGIFVEEKFCEACSYPIYNHPFYSCMSCSFILHETCAYLPLWKRHMLSSRRSKYIYYNGLFECEACGFYTNGFRYKSEGDKFGLRGGKFDVRCASLTDPFVHKSHPHPLYYTSPNGVCSVCNASAEHVLRCIEENCEYIMDYKCALLPYEVKHRVDKDILSLCYGEKEEARGKYWCDICEKETDPRKWYYTSKDGELTLHTDCVLSDVRSIKKEAKILTGEEVFLVVRNKGMSRPFCTQCKSRCRFPFIESWSQGSLLYFCSVSCLKNFCDEEELLAA